MPVVDLRCVNFCWIGWQCLMEIRTDCGVEKGIKCAQMLLIEVVAVWSVNGKFVGACHRV
jgi:hypothetical protein